MRKFFGILAVVFVLAIGPTSAAHAQSCNIDGAPAICEEIGAKYFSIEETADGNCILVCEERNAGLLTTTPTSVGVINLIKALTFFFENASGIPPLVILRYTHDSEKCTSTWLEFFAGPERAFLGAVGKGCRSDENTAAHAVAIALAERGTRHITDFDERERALNDFRARLVRVE